LFVFIALPCAQPDAFDANLAQFVQNSRSTEASGRETFLSSGRNCLGAGTEVSAAAFSTKKQVVEEKLSTAVDKCRLLGNKVFLSRTSTGYEQLHRRP
jgi:hypothetical protein